jgi:hypothetical protein
MVNFNALAPGFYDFNGNASNVYGVGIQKTFNGNVLPNPIALSNVGAYVRSGFVDPTIQGDFLLNDVKDSFAATNAIYQNQYTYPMSVDNSWLA